MAMEAELGFRRGAGPRVARRDADRKGGGVVGWEGMNGLGRGLVVAGLLLLLLGLGLLFLERIPGFRPGKLPGDISISKGNWRFYFPLGTSLLISLLLSALLSFVLWLFSRR